jgi:hypothetical protein
LEHLHIIKQRVHVRRGRGDFEVVCTCNPWNP